VHPPAFVIGRHLGKGLGGFKRKILGQSDMHGRAALQERTAQCKPRVNVDGALLPIAPPPALTASFIAVLFLLRCIQSVQL
jgi:hypothetical protein